MSRFKLHLINFLLISFTKITKGYWNNDSGVIYTGPCYNNALSLDLFSNTTEGIAKCSFRLCFDSRFESSLFTNHIINGIELKNTNFTEQKCLERTNTTVVIWNPGTNFTVDLEKCYNRSHQNITFANQLGSFKYINETMYLTKLQLIPKCDILFCDELKYNATFHYANVIPIWKYMYDGNWKELEKIIRNFAIDNHATLTVLTGTFRTLTLKNTKEDLTNIYLAKDRFDNVLKKVPVPRLIWKVLHHEQNNTGVVFVLINNPYYNITRSVHKYADFNDQHSSTDLAQHFICPNVCSLINWLTFNTTVNLTPGYIYCCNITSFISVVHYIPEFYYPNGTFRNISLLQCHRNGNDSNGDGLNKSIDNSSNWRLLLFLCIVLLQGGFTIANFE